MRSGRRRSWRAGVMASVSITNMIVQPPVWWVTNSIGLAPRRPVKALQARSPSGASANRKTTAFVHLFLRIAFNPNTLSEILAQIHAGIERGHLVGIAVEHQGRTAQKFAQTALFGLAPAGVIDVGVHVRVETVLTRVRNIPSGRRFILHKADFNDRLNALEPVFPGQHDTHRGAVLVGKRFTVHPKTEKG